MLRNPRHRIEALRLKKRAPDNDLERSLYVNLHGEDALTEHTPLRPWVYGTPVNALLDYPFEIFKTPGVRGVLEAFLLASDNDFEVAESVRMLVDEVAAYRQLFFDTSTFKSDLEIIAFLQKIPDDDTCKPLFKIAFHQGLGALRWHFCRDKGSVAPEEVIRNVMVDNYYRSLEHRGAQITSKVAKEAVKLAKISVDCAKALLAKSDGTLETVESLRFKFEPVEPNKSYEELEDILH